MAETLGSEHISTKRDKLAQLSKQMPNAVLTTLAHHVDLAWLREAYRLTRKDGAAGIDGENAESYEAKLEENLSSLLERFKSGGYRAPAVKRVYIPKADGKRLRPIGIPTLEDKVLQRAVLMVLEPVYEQQFLDCSYGFRPGRSAHQALETLWSKLMGVRGGWVLELDIESFFDHVDHAHLRQMLDQRVGDGVIRRAIGKWLNAGVMEAGVLSYPDAGTPQGGVISPLLANLYLHEVLDCWFEHEVKPRLRGQAFEVRYADDAVLGFAREDDARRVVNVIGKRFAKYGLRLHAKKTRLLRFCQPTDDEHPRGGAGGGRSFDFLGFTHFWGRSRNGRWVVRRKTGKDRLSRALRAIAHWCRANRHEPVSWQYQALTRKLKGHYAYYGITGNGRALGRFLHAVERIWRKWLSRRSHATKLPWERFVVFLRRHPLPSPRVVHSIYRRTATA